jgi:hypothetical protein
VKQESELSRFIVKDLPDQPQAGSLLVVAGDMGVMTFEVDAYTAKPEQVVGFRRAFDLQSGEWGLLPVVSFHAGYKWMVINKDVIELVTVHQLRMQAQTDMVALERAKKGMQDIYQAAQEGRLEDLPPTPKPAPPADPDLDQWLERELRRLDQLGEGETGVN